MALLRSYDDGPLSKKKKRAEVPPVPGKDSQTASPSPECSNRSQVPEEVLKYSCLGLQRATDLAAQLDTSLKEWNKEFVTLKYFQREYRRRYKDKAKEVADLESQLSDCRAELADLVTSLCTRVLEVDKARAEAAEAQTSASQARKSLKASEANVRYLKSKITELTALMSEREAQTDSQVIENFKSSMAFKMIIQEHVQKERDLIYSVEARNWEKQGREEGFLLGFLKTTRLVQRQTGVDVEGLSPSQVSEDPPSDIEDETVSIPGSPEEDVDFMDL